MGRLKYGLTGKAIIQIAIASPASSDTISIILSYLTFLLPRISRRFDTAIPIGIYPTWELLLYSWRYPQLQRKDAKNALGEPIELNSLDGLCWGCVQRLKNERTM